MKMPKFICTDGDVDVTISANSAREAAQAFVDGGSWDPVEETEWIDISVTKDPSDIEARLVALIGEHDYSEHTTGWWVYDAKDLDIEALRTALPECTLQLDAAGDISVDHGFEHKIIVIAINPAEPKCTAKEHDWRSPYSVLGGNKENPGVSASGGGVVIKEVCAHCGTYRVTDTWAQNPENGIQGLESVTYEQADDVSQEWIASRSE
jgi:hypothetical protein